MQCHQCHFNGKGSPRCITCRDTLNQPYNHGQTHVSVDAPIASRDGRSRTVGERIGSGAMAVIDIPPSFNPNLPKCCRDAARKVLATFLQMTDEDCNLVRHMLNGGTLEGYGIKCGMPKQSISFRVMSIARKYRHFSFLTQSMKVPNEKDASRKESAKPEKRPS